MKSKPKVIPSKGRGTASFVVLLLVVVLGVGLFVRRDLDGLRARHREVMAQVGQEIASARQENGRSAKQLKEARADASSAPQTLDTEVPGQVSSSDPAVRKQALVSLTELYSRQGFGRLELSRAARGGMFGRGLVPAFAVTSSGQLPNRFGELFGLEPSEVERLQQRLVSVKERVEARILANTSLRRVGENSFVLEVKSLGEESEVLRAETMTAFQLSLGEAGVQTLSKLNGETATGEGGLGALFGSFGSKDQTMTFSLSNQGYEYDVKSSPRGGSSGGTASSLNREDLLLRFGPAIKLLPPEFFTPSATQGSSQGGGGQLAQLLTGIVQSKWKNLTADCADNADLGGERFPYSGWAPNRL